MDIHKILPSFQSSPSSSTISYININMNIKSKETIRGHSNYSLSCYRSLTLWCNSSFNQHGVIITSSCPQIRNPLWPIKVETIVCNIIHHSPPLWPYLTIIYQTSLKYQNILFNKLVRKNFYIQEGLEGGSSIINVGCLVYYDNKITVYTMVPLWNLPFTFAQVK